MSVPGFNAIPHTPTVLPFGFPAQRFSFAPSRAPSTRAARRDSDYGGIRFEHAAHGRALARELGVGCDLDRGELPLLAKDGEDPLSGVHRDRRLLDDDERSVGRAGDVAGRLLDVGEAE